MAKRKPRIGIEFAIVSIKAGRKTICRLVGDNRGDGVRVPITLTGYLTYAWGHDDGIDQEFAMDVESATVELPDHTEGKG